MFSFETILMSIFGSNVVSLWKYTSQGGKKLRILDDLLIPGG
jgi:hypothetical protein